jgi:hypothetical protein
LPFGKSASGGSPANKKVGRPTGLGRRLLVVAWTSEDVLHQRDQDLLDRTALAGVAEQGRDIRVEVQRNADVLGVVAGSAVKGVDGHDEGQLAPLEVIDGREAVAQAAGIGQDHGTERAIGQVVPHEPETILARGAEQVQHQAGAHRDPAEVHGNRRRSLAGHPGEIVDADSDLRQGFLGTQRADLADRADQRGLAHAEPPGHNDLDRGELAAIGLALRGSGAHRVPP